MINREIKFYKSQGKPIRGIQIGTVGTLPEYRNQGLSKYLMELVLNKYNNSTELVFLFANDTVLDFYPKFGFQRAMESIYILNSSIPNPQYSTRKLNLNSIVDLKIIEELLNKRQMLTSIFGATDFQFITMWHLIYGFPENIFYLEDEDIIIIYTINNNQMHIWDIIYSKKFDFSKVFPKFIAGNSVNSIYYYFPPDKVNFNYDEVIEDKKSIFFIKGNFPLKGKYFKFPITAQT